MNKEEIMQAWAPDDSPWSTWAKPVLFAHLESFQAVANIQATADVTWCPPPQTKMALVLDLPGMEGVQAGVALAMRGYRPVPLYNAVPRPGGESVLDPSAFRNVAAVDVLPIISALRAGAEELLSLPIPAEAPPAFLLDAQRHGDGRIMGPGEFDNRSVLFTTDFPSANFLAAKGIQKVLLVQKNTLEPQWDLMHVLRRWQDGGLKLERLRLDPPSQAEPFSVGRPSWFGAMFARVLVSFGLRRAAGGGFGAWVPEASAGG